MNKVLNIIFLGLIYSSAVFSQTRFLQPELKIVDNKIQISWKTSVLTGKSTVYYTPMENHSGRPFPDYYERARDTKIDSLHIITLDKIKTGIEYNYRVTCISQGSFDEYRSINYKFKVIEKNGDRKEGIVITEGPIISNVTPTSAIFSFRTNLSSNVKINYYTKENQVQSISSKKLTKNHEISLSGLKPDCIYNYSITFSNEEDILETRKYTFKTAPSENKFKSFSFIILSDSRGGPEPDYDCRINGVNYLVLNKLIGNIKKKKPSLLLFAGDLISGGCSNREEVELEYKTWKQSVAEITSSIPIYSSIGNHDALGYQNKREGVIYDPPPPNSNEDIFSDEFVLPENFPENEYGYPPYKENVYSFDYGDIHFVSLNSDYYYCYIPNKKILDDPYAVKIDWRQRRWLEEDLKKNTKKRVILFFHSPAFPAGGHIGSSMDRIPEIRDSLFSILNKYNVKMIFNGHEHNYSRTKIDKEVYGNYNKTIYQIVAGRSGAPSYEQDLKNPVLKNVQAFSRKNHYVLVDVQKEKLFVRVYDESDIIIDQFEVK